MRRDKKISSLFKVFVYIDIPVSMLSLNIFFVVTSFLMFARSMLLFRIANELKGCLGFYLAAFLVSHNSMLKRQDIVVKPCKIIHVSVNNNSPNIEKQM